MAFKDKAPTCVLRMSSPCHSGQRKESFESIEPVYAQNIRQSAHVIYAHLLDIKQLPQPTVATSAMDDILFSLLFLLHLPKPNPWLIRCEQPLHNLNRVSPVALLSDIHDCQRPAEAQGLAFCGQAHYHHTSDPRSCFHYYQAACIFNTTIRGYEGGVCSDDRG